MFSALTLNIALAIFSMVMAIVALSLLAFVLAKVNTERSEDVVLQESQADKSPIPRYVPREKVKRHESTTVDFRNPSS